MRRRLLSRFVVFGASAIFALSLVRAGEDAGSEAAIEQVDFERHIAPLLLKHGCNAGSCHGAAKGQAGFRLSLFGCDPTLDFQAITAPDTGRVDLTHPKESLLLQKPAQIVDHGGGERFAVGSPEFQLLFRWIRQGAVHHPGSGRLASLDISPSPVVLTDQQPEADLHVVATYANGDRDDVTRFAEFRVDEGSVAALDQDHVVHRRRAGDTVIVAVYAGRPVSTRVLAPREGPRDVPEPDSSGNVVDQYVEARLAELNIGPSPRCSDEVFLRRLMLTTIGQLPTPEQVREFVQDDTPDKRRRAIDLQLKHPLHAALWATRMCELTGSRDAGSGEIDAESRREEKWHAWFRARFERNAPYDELARAILTATTREGQTADEFLAGSIATAQQAVLNDEGRYAQRKTLDLFWQRPSVNEEVALESLAERVAAAFLGIRMECARCHKHPFDRWTQNDHRSFVQIFSQVRYGLAPGLRVALADQLETQRKRAETGQPTSRIPKVREVFVTTTDHDLSTDETDAALAPRPLGGTVLARDGDRREQFTDWLLASNNRFFARSFVNRVWSVCFGRGLVEPVDTFSEANPPTHPELLDALAEHFIAGGYDIRALEATILSSRAWQRSSQATATNRQDTHNYAHFSLRVPPADVLVDAISAAVGDPRSHAVEEPKFASHDEDVQLYFHAFSRPERKMTCDCERSSEPTLRQAMLLLSDEKLRARTDRAAAHLSFDEEYSLDRAIDDLFLRSLSRWPTEQERQVARKFVQEHADSQSALSDVLWGLINTREFITLH